MRITGPVAGDTQSGQHTHDPQRRADAVREGVDTVTDADVELRGQITADRGLTRLQLGTGDPGRVLIATEATRGGEVRLEQLSGRRGAARSRRGCKRRARERQRQHAVDVGVREAREPRPQRGAVGEAADRDDLVDRAELFERAAPYRRGERVADDERSGHDRGSQQRSEHDEDRLARAAGNVAERESTEHRPPNEHVQERQRTDRDDDHCARIIGCGRRGPPARHSRSRRRASAPGGSRSCRRLRRASRE